MSDKTQITFAHGTDVGRVRDHNEDTVAVFEPADPAMQRQGRLFIVADGMGGYLAGEVASRLAAETTQREYYADPSEEPATRLQNAVQAANAVVFDSAHSERAHSGMGTTLVAAALVESKAYVAAVGDSRVYVVHQGQLSQVTQDHSFVGEQLRAGLLTKEQARLHPQRNVITRALGSQPTVQVDLFEGDLAEGDLLLLCSDGLTGHVPEDQIRETLCQLPPAQAVKRLIEQANESGGSDNISAIVLRVESSTKSATMGASASPKRDTQPTLVGARPTAGEPARKARSISLMWVALGGGVVLVGAAIIGLLALGMGSVWLLGNHAKVTPTLAPSMVAPVTVTPLPTIALTAALTAAPTAASTAAPTAAPMATQPAPIAPAVTLDVVPTATVPFTPPPIAPSASPTPTRPPGTRNAATESGTNAPPSSTPQP